MENPSESIFINRELSWLDFDSRVLALAKEKSVPLAERIKFAAIFGSNMDEFFMVRVGSLYDQTLLKNNKLDIVTHMTPSEQIAAITPRVAELQAKCDKYYQHLLSALKENKYIKVDFDHLDKQQEHYWKAYFTSEILPILSPQVVDQRHPFPFLRNKEIYYAAQLNSKSDGVYYGIIPLSGQFEQLLFIKNPDGTTSFAFADELIAHYAASIFNKSTLQNACLFRVTRNADITVDEGMMDHDIDFRDVMSELLKKRRKLAAEMCIRDSCLSQLYHEYKRGIKAGYAKFETFPIWNIPLKHPVNLAYEAATADLNDVNMIDPFHLEAYGKTAVNYNRDIEIFPVVNAMFELIAGKSPYHSPTDMGVNMAGNCIIDDEVCQEASRKEIIRRYFKCLCDQKTGGIVKDDRYKLELLLNQAGVSVGMRAVEQQAHACSDKTGGRPAAAIELPDGTIVTGKTGPLLGAAASALLNALKRLAGIDQELNLVSAHAIEPIQTLKTQYLGSRNPRLHTDEILIALSSSVTENAAAAAAMHQLPMLKGCDVHSTVILSSVDADTLKKLGMNLTCDPVYEETGRKYHKI